MGTRAVVHADLRPFNYGKDIWIATHWDGNPESLGKSLTQALRDEVKIAKKRGKGASADKGGIIQKAVWKGSADHHIDFSTTDGKKAFDKMYDDFAEWEYEITPEGKVIVRPLADSWSKKKPEGKWKTVAKIGGLRAESKLKKVI